MRRISLPSPSSLVIITNKKNTVHPLVMTLENYFPASLLVMTKKNTVQPSVMTLEKYFTAPSIVMSLLKI